MWYGLHLWPYQPGVTPPREFKRKRLSYGFCHISVAAYYESHQIVFSAECRHVAYRVCWRARGNVERRHRFTSHDWRLFCPRSRWWRLGRIINVFLTVLLMLMSLTLVKPDPPHTPHPPVSVFMGRLPHSCSPVVQLVCKLTFVNLF